ncbi:hypothetical protein ONS95_009600 [Cadophora gregata]|uniref:uncharacterized protein n=1 Tax=Cadophora gregata TaxID=51156 RepID=UPI0026DBE129|nr:uncharacterized protein ONS95_009600 [Cadophora gregata]KAK0124654.1 hypothetical protein ONS95_009600 [Cadophora gregata]KAK0129486.1 hypothetical protein ONS96_000055 [Cadophora gregata f. sp. sojae]
MSESISQLEQDIPTLTSQFKTLEFAFSSNVQSSTISHPSGPRWLSLSPYKRASTFFEQWAEDTEDLMPAPPTKSEQVTTDDDIMSESQISHLNLDASAEEEKTDEILDILDHARCRTLGALRCYNFNLEIGTLVTGEKVDEQVGKSLERLLESSAGIRQELTDSQNMNSLGIEDEGDLSDEERLVGIVEWYMKQLQYHGAKPTQDVVDMAARILHWAMEHGTTNVEEKQRKVQTRSHWWGWT